MTSTGVWPVIINVIFMTTGLVRSQQGEITLRCVITLKLKFEIKFK